MANKYFFKSYFEYPWISPWQKYSSPNKIFKTPYIVILSYYTTWSVNFDHNLLISTFSS